MELATAFGERMWQAYAIAATVNTLVVFSVYAGWDTKARDDDRVICWAFNTALAATIVSNVHHGLRTPFPPTCSPAGWVPDIDALTVAAIIGVIVSLWVPLATEPAYRALLWTIRPAHY